MEEEEGGGPRLSKRFADKGGEVDYKTKAGTAWSHNFLNQKPWHPLSYPNQRRKWIAEQTHAQKQRRSDEIAREYAQEQEFFRQTALASKKEKEKLEMMKAVSFMYVRPPGYNPESAKAAEVEDERKKQEHVGTSQSVMAEGDSETKKVEPVEEKKKPRPKDVFGRLLPTEEQFEVLKNAPRLDTGAPGRAKPFAVEIRNVKCVRCGTFGHQSGDRECPLKDTIMPNEESRLKRDDPLTAILAQTESAEPLKWELKQKPGLSPPRGGFTPDDPNQQIVAEDIFDEYGGFLAEGDNIPDLLLSNFSRSMTTKKKKKSSKSRHRRRSPDSSDNEETGSSSSSSSSDHRGRRRSKKRHRAKKRREPDDESFGKSDRHHQKRSSSGIKSRHCRHSDTSGKYKSDDFHHHRHHHHNHHRRHRSRSLSE
ncbi:unnamed protein product [Cuscuta campestris]|uniref:CBF1-interacting co-repressor CIR N-terminal domain-containing protein n=1 Tax=Cuscuta campestris TaxID=132261 RepID=A0A484KYN4_9ASTE|nr:unnamed protein product [Cuscuta campestris]